MGGDDTVNPANAVNRVGSQASEKQGTSKLYKFARFLVHFFIFGVGQAVTCNPKIN
jgi:hypothetical protein